MIKKNEFLATYNLTEADLDAAELSWKELERIGTEFEIIRPVLKNIGKNFDFYKANSDTYACTK